MSLLTIVSLLIIPRLRPTFFGVYFFSCLFSNIENVLKWRPLQKKIIIWLTDICDTLAILFFIRTHSTSLVIVIFTAFSQQTVLSKVKYLMYWKKCLTFLSFRLFSRCSILGSWFTLSKIVKVTNVGRLAKRWKIFYLLENIQ